MSIEQAQPKGFRTFTCKKDDGSTVVLSVRHPSKEEVDAGDMEYSAVFNHALMSKIPTRAKMIRVLRENGVLERRDEERSQQLVEEVKGYEQQLSDMEKLKFDEGTPEAKDLADRRADVLGKRLVAVQEANQLAMEINAMLGHTADAKAETAQRNFLMACVVEHGDGDRAGTRLWESVDEMLATTDLSLFRRCLYSYTACQNGTPDSWDDEITEPVIEGKPRVDADQAESGDSKSA